jgi:hypothetical protein
MIDWKRVKRQWAIPSYRTKLFFFILLGSSTILLAFLVKNPPWQDILVQFAIVFLAVALVQLVWDFLGGSPESTERADQISSIVVLGDLMKYNIGLERIWPSRHAWEADQRDGRGAWKIRMVKADTIDIMESTLQNWVQDQEFRQNLIAGVDRGTKVRILLYDPDSDAVQAHAHAVLEHSDEAGFTPSLMQVEIHSTLETLYHWYTKMEKPTNLEIRLTTDSLHWAKIFRADEQMIVTTYLAAKSAGVCPVMQIRGAGTIYFKTYIEQFDIMWRRARRADITKLSKLAPD